MTYQTVTAAERLLSSTNRDTWALADAVLADVPERHAGRPQKSVAPATDFADVREALADVVAELAVAGIATPNGDPYTVDALRVLRLTAMSWPSDERHPEAAYRTHLEATGRGRAALAGLCAVARGESVDTPTDLDPIAWADAVQRVQTKLGKRSRRFPVAANDVRVACERKPNTPARGATTTELLSLVADMGAGARTFARTIAESEAGIADDERIVLVEAIERLVETLHGLIAVVQGVTDADLSALLAEGRET